jgi:hypothetical protein
MGYRITRLAVEGFKSISKKQSIRIEPLTILAGANSSGKSSIMQPLLLLKQTLDAPYDPGGLKIDGENVKFSSADQFLSRNTRNLDLEIGVGGNATLGLTFAKTPRAPFGIVEQRWTDDDRTGSIRVDDPKVSRDRFWLRPAEPGETLTTKIQTAKKVQLPPISFLQQLIQKVIHVPGLRGHRERLYPVANTGPLFPATFDYYLASVIEHWQLASSEKIEALNRDLLQLGLTRKVVARRITDVGLDLQVSRLIGRKSDMVSIADVGFGVSQVLPVLVALRVATTGQLVYLEEPEIHLHPRAQTKLADVLADAAERGVRVVAETHSSLLLTAIQTLVAKRKLRPELVKLHWFQRDPKTGITQVSSADLDENGAFGDWPEDFDSVALDAEGAYLDAVESRQVG